MIDSKGPGLQGNSASPGDLDRYCDATPPIFFAGVASKELSGKVGIYTNPLFATHTRGSAEVLHLKDLRCTRIVHICGGGDGHRPGQKLGASVPGSYCTRGTEACQEESA